jgi:hypothetical protein
VQIPVDIQDKLDNRLAVGIRQVEEDILQEDIHLAVDNLVAVVDSRLLDTDMPW